MSLKKLKYFWLYRVPVRADMDEYDELFEIQDDFEDQFADELEALAEMEGEDQELDKNTFTDKV